jgi:hypothetical protein
LPNIVLRGRASNNSFSNNSYNLTLFGAQSIKDNIFKGNSNGSYISASLITTNTFGDFSNNSFYGEEFYSNTIESCENNIHDGSYFAGNRIAIMSNNNIQADFEGNVLAIVRDNNMEIAEFSHNKLARVIGNTMSIFGDGNAGSFHYNIGGDVQNSTFKGFEYTYINSIESCTFNDNVTKLAVNCSLDYVDFTSSTIVYKTESKEIGFAENDNYFISYFDQYGARIINDINA